MLKRANVYFRKGWFFVHAASKTTDGVWVVAPPCTKHEGWCDATELGGAIRAALEGSCSGVPHPSQLAALVAPILELSGVRSWSLFTKRAAAVDITELHGKASIAPMAPLGDGFAPDRARLVIVDAASDDAVGSAVRSIVFA